MNHADGGRYALVGFIQQMLGSSADYIRYISPPSEGAGGEFQALVSFEVEVHGQDQSVTGRTLDGKKRILTQYKYSLSERPIRPQELAEIAETLRRSAIAANAVED
jgi:hypothetical protein